MIMTKEISEGKKIVKKVWENAAKVMTKDELRAVTNRLNEVKKLSGWYWLRFDGRKKRFKGIPKEIWEAEKMLARNKAAYRSVNKGPFLRDFIRQCRERREMIAYFANVPYNDSCDYDSDWQKFQRPASNGVGYVAICPGERGNNTYVDDKMLVKYLVAKYNKNKGAGK